LDRNGRELSGLKYDLPGLTPISLNRKGSNDATKWQYLPADLEDFEDLVIRACGFIKNDDPRVGHIPNSPKKSRLYGF
jgi:hypothetical protein